MNVRARPAVLGVFVTGAFVLVLGMVAALTARRWLAEYRTYVVFFPYAVGGLKEGAPVTFRQVPVGQVRNVDLVFATDAFRESHIMAIIDIRRGSFRTLAGRAPALSDDDLARLLIDGGLRASVRSSSLIAGQKSIDLDYQPEQKPRLSGITMPYPEIPTAPTGMELLNERVEATLRRVSEVPVDQVLLQLQATLLALQEVLQSGDVPETMRELRTTLRSATRALAGAEQAVGRADGLTADARVTLATVNATMKELNATIGQMSRTLATVDRNVDRSGDVQVEAGKTLEEMGELLKALRSLVETMQQNPESLLRGKPEPAGQKR